MPANGAGTGFTDTYLRASETGKPVALLGKAVPSRTARVGAISLIWVLRVRLPFAMPFPKNIRGTWVS